MTALEQAKSFLVAELKNGPMAAQRIEADARKAGYSRDTLCRAKKILGIKSVKGKETNASWEWILPTDNEPSLQASIEATEDTEDEHQMENELYDWTKDKIEGVDYWVVSRIDKSGYHDFTKKLALWRTHSPP